MKALALLRQSPFGRSRTALAWILTLLTCASATLTARAEDMIVGFIYVGPKDDYGYNQAHHEGAVALSKMPGVKVIEQEKVPETLDVQKTMESMINLDGATLLFPTSFGYYKPHVLEMARKYPDIVFLHCGGLYNAATDPANAGSYFGYIDECVYLNGIAAGYATKTGKLGFVAAKPIPQVLRNINSFELGAKSVNPKVTTTVVFTGDWSDPVKEAEASKLLIDGGADVLTCHVDSPKVVVQTAEQRGVFVCGYHCDQSTLAPKGYLVGALWNWGNVYKKYVEEVRSGAIAPGNKWDHMVRGGLKDGFVRMSAFGPAVTDESKATIAKIEARMMAGDFVIFKGPMLDNQGNTVITAGAEKIQTDPSLEQMNWLVEGVIGSTGN